MCWMAARRWQRRVGDTQLVGAMYHVPDGAYPDFAAINILANILGNAPSGRLYKALVETKKAANVKRAPCRLMILAC